MKNYGLTFYLKLDKTNQLGLAPIYLRIIVGSTRTTLNTGHNALPEVWKKSKQLKITRKPEEINIRMKLNAIGLTFSKMVEKLEAKGMGYDAMMLKVYFQNGNIETFSEHIMLSELFDKHILDYSKLVESGNRVKDSLRKIKSVRKHVIEFLKQNYKKEDIAINTLNFRFIDGFDLFLRTTKKIGNNTTVKYVQSFRQLINVAIKYDWIEKDPFKLYDKKIIKVDTVWLTQEELDAIENVILPGERLEVVRDIFIFGCYTGYAPVDLHKLTYNHIAQNNDGQKWIFTKRTKTGVKSDVPLLPKAEKIIDTYRNHPFCQATGLIIPKRSNQSANEYLKEICILAGISKEITMYTSRHTFATTVILSNGISLEVLSKLMGHTDQKMSMHYGKIQNARVGQEMSILRDKLNKKMN